MHQFDWQKHGLIFNLSEKYDWMQMYAQVPTVLEKESVLRIYFACRPQPDEQGMFISYTGYVDVDKKDYSVIKAISPRPVVELGNTGTFDEFGVHPTSVVEKDGLVYLYYTGWSRSDLVSYKTWIGLLVSADGGATFERYSEAPILGETAEGHVLNNGAMVFPWKDGYQMIYAAATRWVFTDKTKPEPVYTLKRAFSSDGLEWKTEPGNIIEPFGENECLSRPGIFISDHGCYLWYGYRKIFDFRGGEDSYKMGFAFAKDGLNWQRNDDAAGIILSDTGWDSEMMSYPYLFEREDSLVMFYNGNYFGREGFGYATASKCELVKHSVSG